MPVGSWGIAYSSTTMIRSAGHTTRWAATNRRIKDRIVFDKLVGVLVFGCSYEKIAIAAIERCGS